MKKLILTAMIAGLLMLPFPLGWHTAQAAIEAPPVAQPLVREGDLATSLIEVLGMAPAQDEAQAESKLTALGIQPQNGWMADYPVTPEIIGQLRKSIGEAADSQKLAMEKEEALDAFQSLLDDFGLAVSTATPESQTAENPPESYPEYVEPDVVDDYYYQVGPPVITYYVPPPAYYPLYTWVYYPFWYSGAFFRGYFILNSFDRVILFRHRHVIVRDYGHFHRHLRRFHRQLGERHERDLGNRRHSYYEGRSPSVRERGPERRRPGGSIAPRGRDNVLKRGGIPPARRIVPPARPIVPRARPIVPPAHRAGRPEAFRHRGFGASGRASLERRQHRFERFEAFRRRDFSSGRRSLTRPVVPQQRRGAARSFNRPSGGGFSGRHGFSPGRLGGRPRGAVGRR